jgi:hypothetical protein
MSIRLQARYTCDEDHTDAEESAEGHCAGIVANAARLAGCQVPPACRDTINSIWGEGAIGAVGRDASDRIRRCFT